jgi:excisionase family DNA binding protein
MPTITVAEAGKIAERDPETIRRWIRSGKLRARKIGTQHMIERADLDEVLPNPGARR